MRNINWGFLLALMLLTVFWTCLFILAFKLIGVLS